MNITKQIVILTLLSGNAFSANTDGDINMGGRNDNGVHNTNPHIQNSNKSIIYDKIQTLRKRIADVELRLENNNISSVQTSINLSDLSLRLAIIVDKLITVNFGPINIETKNIYIKELTEISNDLIIFEKNLQTNKSIVHDKIQTLRKRIADFELRLESSNPSFEQTSKSLSNLSLRLTKIEVQLGESESISKSSKKIYTQVLNEISNELSVYEFVDAKSNDINRN